MSSYLLKNGIVVNEGESKHQDVLIKNNRIEEMGTDLCDDSATIKQSIRVTKKERIVIDTNFSDLGLRNKLFFIIRVSFNLVIHSPVK